MHDLYKQKPKYAKYQRYISEKIAFEILSEIENRITKILEGEIGITNSGIEIRITKSQVIPTSLLLNNLYELGGEALRLI